MDLFLLLSYIIKFRSILENGIVGQRMRKD